MCILEYNDCLKLQDQLTGLVNWSSQWGLDFNAEKCKIMSIYNGKNKIVFNYIINGKSIEKVNNFVDLGLLVQDNLHWDNHVCESVKRANKRMGFVKRTLGYSCMSKTKQICYTALVRPLVEYGSVLWANQSKKCLNLVEGVQRRATKYILGNFDISYKERLLQCNLLPLSYRYEFLDLMFMYNSINDLTYVNAADIIEYANRTVTRGGNDDSLFLIKRVHLETVKRFYPNRIVHIWNSLPSVVRLTELTDNGHNTEFKTKVKNWYRNLLDVKFDSTNTCTWVTHCLCSRCKMA
jgi:hypothetical protein